MLRMKNIRAQEVNLARQKVFADAGAGAPSATTAAYGKLGPGSTYTDTTTGKIYTNTGTLAAPVWTVVGAQV